MTLHVSSQAKTVPSEGAAVVNLYGNGACIAGPALSLGIQTHIDLSPWCHTVGILDLNNCYVYPVALVPFYVHA